MSVDLPPGLLLEQILPDSHLTPFSSLAFVIMQFVALGVIVLAGAVAGLRWWRRARAAELSFRSDAALVPGDIVIQGAVEYAANEDMAVRVEVDQQGIESESSGNWSTSWTEYNRRVRVRPFYIRHASGQRIRVEPRREVELVDAMDGVIRVNLAHRIRVAELTPGERVFAHGLLCHDTDPEAPATYRGGSFGLVLRPRAGGHLLLSTEPLGARFHRRARMHRRFIYGFLAVCLLCDLTLLPYLILLFTGQPGRAVVTGLKDTLHRDSDGESHTYRVWLQVVEPAQQSFDEPVRGSLFSKLCQGMVLPARVTPTGWTSPRLGQDATYHGALLLLLLGPLGVLVLIYMLTALRPMAWYEGELTEGEGGRLAESKPPPPPADSASAASAASEVSEGE